MLGKYYTIKNVPPSDQFKRVSDNRIYRTVADHIWKIPQSDILIVVQGFLSIHQKYNSTELHFRISITNDFKQVNDCRRYAMQIEYSDLLYVHKKLVQLYKNKQYLGFRYLNRTNKTVWEFARANSDKIVITIYPHNTQVTYVYELTNEELYYFVKYIDVLINSGPYYQSLHHSFFSQLEAQINSLSYQLQQLTLIVQKALEDKVTYLEETLKNISNIPTKNSDNPPEDNMQTDNDNKPQPPDTQPPVNNILPTSEETQCVVEATQDVVEPLQDFARQLNDNVESAGFVEYRNEMIADKNRVNEQMANTNEVNVQAKMCISKELYSAKYTLRKLREENNKNTTLNTLVEQLSRISDNFSKKEKLPVAFSKVALKDSELGVELARQIFLQNNRLSDLSDAFHERYNYLFGNDEQASYLYNAANACFGVLKANYYGEETLYASVLDDREKAINDYAYLCAFLQQVARTSYGTSVLIEDEYLGKKRIVARKDLLSQISAFKRKVQELQQQGLDTTLLQVWEIQNGYWTLHEYSALLDLLIGKETGKRPSPLLYAFAIEPVTLPEHLTYLKGEYKKRARVLFNFEEMRRLVFALYAYNWRAQDFDYLNKVFVRESKTEKDVGRTIVYDTMYVWLQQLMYADGYIDEPERVEYIKDILSLLTFEIEWDEELQRILEYQQHELLGLVERKTNLVFKDKDCLYKINVNTSTEEVVGKIIDKVRENLTQTVLYILEKTEPEKVERARAKLKNLTLNVEYKTPDFCTLDTLKEIKSDFSCTHDDCEYEAELEHYKRNNLTHYELKTLDIKRAQNDFNYLLTDVFKQGQLIRLIKFYDSMYDNPYKPVDIIGIGVENTASHEVRFGDVLFTIDQRTDIVFSCDEFRMNAVYKLLSGKNVNTKNDTVIFTVKEILQLLAREKWFARLFTLLAINALDGTNVEKTVLTRFVHRVLSIIEHPDGLILVENDVIQALRLLFNHFKGYKTFVPLFWYNLNPDKEDQFVTVDGERINIWKLVRDNFVIKEVQKFLDSYFYCNMKLSARAEEILDFIAGVISARTLLTVYNPELLFSLIKTSSVLQNIFKESYPNSPLEYIEEGILIFDKARAFLRKLFNNTKEYTNIVYEQLLNSIQECNREQLPMLITRFNTVLNFISACINKQLFTHIQQLGSFNKVVPYQILFAMTTYVNNS